MIPFRFETENVAAPVGRTVFIPAGIETKMELLAFLKGALAFPEYFGSNWDALEECLGEINEADGETITLFHRDIPLGDHPSDQIIYLRILTALLRVPGRFEIVFPELDRDSITRLLP